MDFFIKYLGVAFAVSAKATQIFCKKKITVFFFSFGDSKLQVNPKITFHLMLYI